MYKILLSLEYKIRLLQKRGGRFFCGIRFGYFKLWYFSCKIFGGGIMYEIELTPNFKTVQKL